MSILYTVVGSAVGAAVSRSMLIVIDHLDRNDPSINKELWWGLLFCIVTLVLVTIITLVRYEHAKKSKGEKFEPSVESFIPAFIPSFL